MKRKDNIREMLGLTQMQMAMLLQISRAQWSMYESGRRSLPMKALILLADVLMCYQNIEKGELKELIPLINQEKKDKKLLEAMLKENQYQQLLVNRRIETTAKKYQAHIKTLHFVELLADSSKITDQTLSVLKMIQLEAKKGIELNGTPLTKFQIRQTLLQHEELILKAALE